MFRGDWRNLAAIGLTGVLALVGAGTLFLSANSLQSAYQEASQKHAKQYADQATVEQKGCIALPVAKRANCKGEAQETARKGQRDEYDLEAQRVTATWTQHMGIAAMIGMAVSIIGVGLIWTTFHETRRANIIAGQALEGQLRPWVDFEVENAGSLKLTDGCWEIIGKIEFNNIGVSPAVDLTYMATMIFGDDPDPHLKELVEKFDTSELSWADKNLFHGKAWHRKGVAVHSGTLTGKVQVTYVVIARYRTVYSKTYRFTAKAYDVQAASEGPEGLFYPEGKVVDFDNRPSAAFSGANLIERQHYAGFTT